MNPNARVLIVEDEVFDRAMLAQGLERERELETVLSNVSVDRGFADPVPPVPMTLNRKARRRCAALARRQS